MGKKWVTLLGLWLSVLLAFSVSANTDIGQLTREAQRGSAAAAYKLGNLYDKGEGVEQNLATGRKWFTQAAYNNFAPAQIMLGVKFAKGDEYKQDLQSAYAWFRVAEDNGVEVGRAYREKSQAQLSEPELKQAVKLYEAILVTIEKNTRKPVASK